MKTEVRTARTIRFPPVLLDDAEAVRDDRESLNDLVIAAVEQEVRRRRAFQALDRIRENRELILEEVGELPDSTQLIRELREGIGRGD